MGGRLFQSDPVNYNQGSQNAVEAETHGANEKQKEVEGLPQMHEETEDEVAELMRRLSQCLC